MNGIINIYKPSGMTSFQVVYRVRKITGEQKVGHTGTLDPDATGVLPVCLGKATKLVDQLMDTDKQYRAEMLLGKKTDTQDISGKILEEKTDIQVKELVSKEIITDAFQHFTGEIFQLPPMYSALKVGGVKLVDAARKGKQIERKERPVFIESFRDISINGINDNNQPVVVGFTVNCSKGTYVRTLCEDIGNYLGVPACLLSLERTRTSGLDLSTAVTLEELERVHSETGTVESFLLPTDSFLLNYPEVRIKEASVKKLIYGNWLTLDEFDSVDTTRNIFRVYDKDNVFYALYRYDSADKMMKCEKMFR